MSRWTPREIEAIKEVRNRLHDELTNRPQFPEVVGDRRILRYLRGNGLNVETSCKKIASMLRWRVENGIDEIRNDIVHGKNSPQLFPKADFILSKAPQVLLSTTCLDKLGNPISIESFNFSPREVMKTITEADYIKYLIYCLEFKLLVLEQLSEQKEQELIAAHKCTNPDTPLDNYGVILQHTIIRDLTGIGLGHVGSDGRSILAAGILVSEKNYAEILSKTYVVNAPWIFTAFWYFIQGLLGSRTKAKISILGSDYGAALAETIPPDSLPVQFGGPMELVNGPFAFDTGPGGALYTPPGPLPSAGSLPDPGSDTLPPPPPRDIGRGGGGE